MTVWEDPSFDEISVKQPGRCQSRYSCGTVGLHWTQHWRAVTNGHPSTSQGVTRGLTDVGQKTLGWSLLYFFPQSHCSLPVHTPLETLAFHNIFFFFCISKHDLCCTVWGSVPVPAAGYSHQDQGRIKLWSESRDCCTMNLTCIFLCQVCNWVFVNFLFTEKLWVFQTQALMLNVYLRA